MIEDLSARLIDAGDKPICLAVGLFVFSLGLLVIWGMGAFVGLCVLTEWRHWQ